MLDLLRLIINLLFLFVSLHECSENVYGSGSGSAINMCTLLNDTDIPRELQISCSELMESVDMTMQVPSDSIMPFATVLLSSSSDITGELSETALSLLIDISLPTIGFDRIESNVFSPTPTSFVNSLAPSFSISSFQAIKESLLLTNTYPGKASGDVSLLLTTQFLSHMISIEPDFVSPTLSIEDLELQTTNLFVMSEVQTISNSFTSTITPFSTFGFKDELESSNVISSSINDQFIVNPTLVISPTSQLDYDGLESELATSEFESPISTVIGTNLMVSTIISADTTSDVLMIESSVLLTSSKQRNLESSMHISLIESIGIFESTFVVEPTPTVTDQTSQVESPSIQLSSILLSTPIPGLSTTLYQSSVTPDELLTIVITTSSNSALDIETTPLTSIESTPFVTTSLLSKYFISVTDSALISTNTVELSSSLIRELFTAGGSSLGSFTEIENTPMFSPSPIIINEAVTSMYDAINPSSTVIHLPFSSLDVEMSINSTGNAFTTDLISSILTSTVILPSISLASTSFLIGDAISLSSVSFSPSIPEVITGEPLSLMTTLTSFTPPEPSPSVLESVLIVTSSDITSQSPNVSIEEMVTTLVVLSSSVISSISGLSMAILSANSSVIELPISSFITESVEQTMILQISSPATYTQSSASTAVASFSQAFSPSISSSATKEEITNNLLFLTPSSLFSSTSYTFTTSILRPTSSISAEQIQSSLIRLIIRTTFLEYQPLKNITSQARTDLETAITNVYIDALRGLGANKRRRQTTETATAKITTVGERDGVIGEVPVDFYIVTGSTLVEASIGVAILVRNQPVEIGGYEVISISVVAMDEEEISTVLPNSIIIPVSAIGGFLIVITACLVLTLIAIGTKSLKNRKRVVDAVETVSIDVEAMSFRQHESIAIQHGTPTIEKLVKRTRTGSEPRRNSTLALLASSSSGQTDAWQNNQLGNEPTDEAPAGLFQKASHYSDFQPMPSSRPFKLKFHSSAVAPSPSTSNQSKSSLDGAVRSTEAIIPMSPKAKFRERVKLHSRRVSSRGKQREQTQQEGVVIPNKNTEKTADSEGDGGLGDVEQSSHSDGGEPANKTPPHTSRPSTRRRNARRKLNSRGIATTDGYDTTDHRSHVPPSRQSRKYRSGRGSNSRQSRRTEHDARREIAWMSTGDGVQLISIQPLQQVSRGPSSAQLPTASWQALPQLPTAVSNQPYSREQLEQLLQIHKELERVEQGMQQQGGFIESSADSLTKLKETHSNLDSSSSNFSAELASKAFKSSARTVPDHSRWEAHQYNQLPPPPQMGQLLWTPQSGSQPVQTQPLSPYHLSQLRKASHTSNVLYPTPMASGPQRFHHPFGAS